MDLCLSAAQQRDSQNFAAHYYKSGQPSDDGAGYQAYARRWVWPPGVILFVCVCVCVLGVGH